MKFNYKRREVEFENRKIELTYLENQVLKIIFDETSRCVSYEQLESLLYEKSKKNISNEVISKTSLYLLAARLRKKGIPIKTVRDFGYKI